MALSGTHRRQQAMKFWAHSKRWKPIWSAHSMPRSSSSRFVKQRKISDEGKGWWKQKPVDKGRRRDARQRRERRHDEGHTRMRRALQRRRQTEPRQREQRRSISTAVAAAAAIALHCRRRHRRRRRHSGVASEMCQAGTNQQPMGMSVLTRDAGRHGKRLSSVARSRLPTQPRSMEGPRDAC